MRIFTQVLDGTYGKPAAGVAARLARVSDSMWVIVADAETNEEGRIESWDSRHLKQGLYRIVFDSDSYFAKLGIAIAYPEVAVVFRMEPDSHAFQVQLTLAPYSYSTYFGTVDMLQLAD